MIDSPSMMYGMSQLFSTMFMVIWLPYILVFLGVPVLLYLVARWRQQKAGVPDTHLGIKSALGLFRLISLQLLLAGGWLFVYSIMAGDMPEQVTEVMTRTAFGLMLPGGLIFAGQYLLL